MDGLVTTFTILWGLWILAFCIVEAPAVFKKRKGDTLSEHVWAFKKIKFHGIPLGNLIFAGFWIWLTLHFWLGG